MQRTEPRPHDVWNMVYVRAYVVMVAVAVAFGIHLEKSCKARCILGAFAYA